MTPVLTTTFAHRLSELFGAGAGGRGGPRGRPLATQTHGRSSATSCSSASTASPVGRSTIPYLPVPTLRRLAARGAVAQGMRPVNPTVTWPNHTTLITGVTPAKHGVLFNGLLKRDPGVPPRVEPWLPRDEMVRVKTLYDLAHARGLTTAQVDWVAIHGGADRDVGVSRAPVTRRRDRAGARQGGRALSSRARNLRHPQHRLARSHLDPGGRAHHQPASTQLDDVHLLNLDSTQHRYGPRTPAAMTTMALLDTHVGEIVAPSSRPVLTPNTTFVVVSDHGFRLVKRQIRLNAAFMKAGLLKAQDGKILQSDAYVVPEGGSAIVYLTVPDPTGDLLVRARKAITGIEGDRRHHRACRLRAIRPAASERQRPDGRPVRHAERRLLVHGGGWGGRRGRRRPRAASARTATRQPTRPERALHRFRRGYPPG